MSSIRMMNGMSRSFHKLSSRVPQSTRFFSTAEESQIEFEKQKSLSLEKQKKMFIDYLYKKPTIEERITQHGDLYAPLDSVLEHIETKNYDNFGVYTPLESGDIPPSLRTIVTKEFSACDNYIMMRPYAAELIRKMNKTIPGIIREYKKPYGLAVTPSEIKHDNLHLITGHRGTGKSFTLASAAAYAHLKGWAVLAIDADKFVHDRMGYVIESPVDQGVFEQRLATRKFFEDNYPYMKDAFSRINLLGDYSGVNWVESFDPEFNPPANPELLTRYNRMPFPKPEEIPRPTGEPKTAADLVAIGAWRADLSHFIMKALIFEMQHTKDVPCLIAVDNINCIDQITSYRHPKTLRKLMGKKLSVPNTIMKSLDITPAYGMTVISTSSKYTMKNIDEYIYRCGNNLRVGAYTTKEIQCALEHYTASRHVHFTLDVPALRGIEGVTGRVPEDVRKWCDFN